MWDRVQVRKRKVIIIFLKEPLEILRIEHIQIMRFIKVLRKNRTEY
jgi:hypothetical protein